MSLYVWTAAVVLVAVCLLHSGPAAYNAMAEIMPESEVKRVVEDALDLYGHNGHDSFYMITLDRPNRDADGLYPFVINATSWMRVADGAVPDRVGKPEIILDTTARSVEDVLVDLEANGETWVTYIFYHPSTGTDQLKRAYLQLHDGLVFGSGYYLLDAQVQDLVYEQIREYDGSATLVTNDTVSAETVSTYVFVVNSTTGVMETQNVNSDWDAITSTVQAENLLDTLSRGGTWVGYTFTNPVTGDVESKRTYLALHDGLVFGSGYYSLDIPVSGIKFVVDNAIYAYESNKVNDVWIDIITPDEPIMLDDHYPFVFNSTTWKTVAHGAIPDRLGHVPYAILNTGDRSLEDIHIDLEANGEAWVSYVFTHPPTGTAQLKHTYMRLHDGFIFASGYYVFDSQAQATVQNLILEYVNKGRNATFANLANFPEMAVPNYVFEIDTKTGYARSSLFSSGTPPTYALVADPGTGIIQAHNFDLDLAIIQDWNAITSIVQAEDLLDMLSTEAGTWVTYTHTNPVDSHVESKRIWMALHDGLVFGSGYILP